jgi:hypothetical protein
VSNGDRAELHETPQAPSLFCDQDCIHDFDDIVLQTWKAEMCNEEPFFNQNPDVVRGSKCSQDILLEEPVAYHPPQLEDVVVFSQENDAWVYLVEVVVYRYTGGDFGVIEKLFPRTSKRIEGVFVKIEGGGECFALEIDLRRFLAT